MNKVGRIVCLGIVALCMSFLANIQYVAAYTEEQLPEEPRMPDSPKGQEPPKEQAKEPEEETKEFTCAKVLFPSWAQNAKTVKSKGFIIELRECKLTEQGTACSFSVANCSSKDSWLYLDKSSYLSDGSGGNYGSRVRTFGGKSGGGDDFVKAFLPSGVKENASLVFEKTGKSARKFEVGLVMTGGAWAGDIIKALFHNVRLTE